jgi:hypothetical protein
MTLKTWLDAVTGKVAPWSPMGMSLFHTIEGAMVVTVEKAVERYRDLTADGSSVTLHYLQK